MGYNCIILTMNPIQTAVSLHPNLARDMDRSRPLPLRAGYFPKAHGHRFKREPTPETILIYCINGKGYYRQAKQRRIPIHAGTLLCCSAQTAHEYGADPENPWSIYWMHLHPSGSMGWKKDFGLTNKHPTVSIGVSPAVIHSFDRLVQTMQDAVQPADARLCSALAQLILADLFHEQQRVVAPARMLSHMEDVLGLMKANQTGALSIEQMAQAAGLSKEYFIRQFKKTFGTTPGTYFLQLKMRTACDLLVSSNLHIQEIAFQLGYEDPFYFSRIFKRLRGVSPRQYRQSTRA